MEIIKLNIIPNGTTPTCHASQYDNGRVIRIELYEGLNPYTLSASDEISLAVRKPDNTLVTTSVTNTQADYLDIETTEQMCAVQGFNTCELKIKNGLTVIAMLNFIMQVQPDPTAHGIPSGSALDNLQEQVNDCVEVALEDLYDGTSVMFDSEPNITHNEPYTVTSAGIKTALDNLTASDINYNNQASGLSATNTQQALDELASQSTDVSFTPNQSSGNKIGDLTIDGETTALYTGEISSVDSLNDLTDVNTTGKVNGDSLRYNGSTWVAKPTTVALTQAEYNALQTKALNTHYVITDAPNLNPTANDIEYSGGVTVADKLDSLAFKSYSINNLNFYRFGNIVFFNIIAGTNSTDANGLIVSGGSNSVIRQGYRPPENVNAIDTVTMSRMTCNYDGTILTNKTSQTGLSIRISACWITNDAMPK